MIALLEILTTKRWAINPEFAHVARKTIQNNLNGHIALEPFHKKSSEKALITKKGFVNVPFRVSKETILSETRQGVVAGDEMDDSDQNFHQDSEGIQTYVTILYVTGPITRNGDMCTSGSIELRDKMIQCSKDPKCVGHIFYIDTPGGSIDAIKDFQQGIDVAHENGQKVVAFIDGNCASAGAWIASMCDERHFMHPDDEIGCIGVMAAFYTLTDGKDYDDGTYHEVYDPESYDKNKWYRDAEKGDYKDLIEQLTTDGINFRNDVKAGCPNVKEEHLHGQMFKCSDMIGILVDGQSTLDDVIQRTVALSANGGNSQAAMAFGTILQLTK